MLYRDGYKVRRELMQAFDREEFKDFRYIFAINDFSEPPPNYKGPPEYYADCDMGWCTNQCSGCKFTHEMRSWYDDFGINTKFGFMIQGDTCTSARLYESIANGQIPIIISTSIYENGLPFIRQVPWFDFTFIINPMGTTIEEIVRLIKKKVMKTPIYVIQHMYETMLKYRKHVLWNHPESLVINHILEDAKDTCRL